MIQASDLRVVAQGEEYPYARRTDLYKVRVHCCGIKLGCLDIGGEAEGVDNAQALANKLGHTVELQFLAGGAWEKFEPQEDCQL